MFRSGAREVIGSWWCEHHQRIHTLKGSLLSRLLGGRTWLQEAGLGAWPWDLYLVPSSCFSSSSLALCFLGAMNRGVFPHHAFPPSYFFLSLKTMHWNHEPPLSWFPRVFCHCNKNLTTGSNSMQLPLLLLLLLWLQSCFHYYSSTGAARTLLLQAPLLAFLPLLILVWWQLHCCCCNHCHCYDCSYDGCYCSHRCQSLVPMRQAESQSL